MNSDFDPKCSFIAATHNMDNIHWARHANSETWIYVGSDFQKSKVQDYIDEVFTEDEVLLLGGRADTRLYSRSGILGEVKSRLQNVVISICNKDHTKYMQFSHTGVIRYGDRLA